MYANRTDGVRKIEARLKAAELARIIVALSDKDLDYLQAFAGAIDRQLSTPRLRIAGKVVSHA